MSKDFHSSSYSGFKGDAYEKMQFYYHPDHLGSSSYITNLDGEVVQHIKLLKTRIAPSYLDCENKRNMNAGRTRLISTAVYGKTIFWKANK